MNFENYHHKVEYPGEAFSNRLKKDMQEKLDVFVGNFKEVMAYKDSLESELKTKIQNQQINYNNEYDEIQERFKQDSFVELGIENNPKRNLLWEKVYDHHSTYEEIFYKLESLAGLIC